MGGSAVGGAARARRRSAPRLRAPAASSPTATRCRRWAGPDDARAVLELLGRRPRRRSPAYDDAREPARRGSWPPPAARWPSARARDGVPVDPAARAASSRARRSATRSWPRSRRRALAGAAPSLRDEVEAAAALAERWPPSGGRTAPRTARPRRSRARSHGTVPVIVGRRADRRRSPTAGSASSTRTRSCRRSASALPEADHNEIVRLGRARASSARSPPSSSRTRRRTRATALRIELTAEHRGGGRARRRARRAARGETRARAARLARAARRPRLALPRRAARRRPGRRSRPIDALKAQLADAR